MIDKTERPPITASVQGKVVISNFRMKVAKMKDFLTVLSKAENFIFEYTNGCGGTITLDYAPLKDFKARGICEILAALMKFDSQLKFEAPAAFLTEIHADMCGLRRPLTSQMKDKTLYINNITNDTTEELLKGLVPDCIKAFIPVNNEGNRKGWAVLEFKDSKEADNAMRNVRELELGTDHKVIISRAESSDSEEVAKAYEELQKNPPPKPTPTPQIKIKKEKVDDEKKATKRPLSQDKSKSTNTSSYQGLGSSRGFGRMRGGKPGPRGMRGGSFGFGAMTRGMSSFPRTMGGSSGGMMGRSMLNQGNMGMDGTFPGNMGGRGMGRNMNRGGFMQSQDEDFSFGGQMRKNQMFGNKKEVMMEFLQDALEELQSSKRERGGMGFQDNQGNDFGGGGYSEYDEVPNKRGRWNDNTYGNEGQQNKGAGNRQGSNNRSRGGGTFQQNQGGGFGNNRDMSGSFGQGGYKKSGPFGQGGGMNDKQFGKGDVRNHWSADAKRNTASFGQSKGGNRNSSFGQDGNQFGGSNKGGTFYGGNFSESDNFSFDEGYQQSGNDNQFGGGDDYQSWGQDYQSGYNDDQYNQQQYGSYN